MDLKEWEPVGFFEFTDKSDVLSIPIDFKRPAKYVYLKPTSIYFFFYYLKYFFVNKIYKKKI